MNFLWGHNRRFNSYSEYFKKQFGERVQKVSIDAGFTCPNRDGSLATRGCTYCNNDAFNPSYCDPKKPVAQQLNEGIEFHLKRYRRAKKYLAYFQTYSNTYAPLEKLEEMYSEALKHPGIIGLVIGTRPDCIDDEKLDWFGELAQKYYIIIEYGIESCYNKTLEKINRQHTFEQSVEAIEKTASRGIKTGAHIIFGLPGESREEMLKEAEILSELPINNIKFHQLQIIKNTAMAREYENNHSGFNLFSLEDYVDFIIKFIERLNPEFIIERFTGEVPPRFLSGPNWGLIRNDEINRLIENRLDELDTWQGKIYENGKF
ncbi:MAG: TIGR01212 family radical SAM protein [Bacteroidetes bacterium 4484_249]|nr:MAG: TIGR01212 family radical SAM protein [Bacteroidetes bacterium 4484_249]